MLRIRRYRPFLIGAFIILVLLYHVSQNSDWELSQSALYPPKAAAPAPDSASSKDGVNVGYRPPQQPPKPLPTTTTSHVATLVAYEKQTSSVPKKETGIRIPQLKTSNEVPGSFGLPTPAPAAGGNGKAHDQSAAPEESHVAVKLPDRPVPETHDHSGHHEDDDIKEDDVKPTSTQVHWTKPSEYFPVPKESIIKLPTGKPKAIPTVQAKFGPESPEAKEKRLARLDKVRQEAQRAWSGYKKYAWGHDELTPVTKESKDPFCGWAATLVDSLDTLWIMGLKEEFDEAVEYVKQLDFTYSAYRSEIPVFETTIRYLGGFLGAYDVSGGEKTKAGYKILLDKAVELAEVLMSVFDTPNRMPILYYNWHPAFNVNPKRASTSAGMAELGTLSMEFTRLAQLTGENKYYDAVARITNALEDLQNREGGTALPGIFPEHIDASGCNRTAQAEASLDNLSEAGRQQVDDATDVNEEPQGFSPGMTDQDIQNAKDPLNFNGITNTKRSLDRRTPPPRYSIPKHQPPPWKSPKSQGSPYNAQGFSANWDCVPQGLVAGGWGSESYSMGGSQDSAYEYFPKQYLLLGGLEDKYRTMHLKVSEAVKKYLLFRPMAPGNPDILFSAKVVSPDHTDQKLSYEWEVTHLTCFLGGMFGLGGKIFDSPEDVEIGRKLADGCAWAYEVMPTGIMPEYSMVMPCAKADECEWNRTAWYNAIDTEASWRDQQLRQWEVNHAEWVNEVKRLEEEYKVAKARAEVEAEAAEVEAARKVKGEKETEAILQDAQGQPGQGQQQQQQQQQQTVPKPADHQYNQPKQALNPGVHQGMKQDVDYHLTRRKRQVPEVAAKVNRIEDELDLNNHMATSHHQQQQQQQQSREQQQYQQQKPLLELHLPPEPEKPMSHEEYVKDRLEREKIPEGFVTLNDRRYILRPEAIESIFYYYRITGSSTWQDKGWKMFESIISAVRTDVAHSAIDNVAFVASPSSSSSIRSYNSRSSFSSATKYSAPGSSSLRDEEEKRATKGGPAFTDSMESFWLAETLKYFYLLFAEPEVISLDEWVLNTEAHPFRRPT
ncbi:glycosyl hydrolase family 47-domain-containing protein [Sordaria brevicollis]|uniref:alpha-1,2-Mannosidase n=1 Tax=Sordaria brevicollis TaxID=83679 RepID=A0AAE0PIJ0_SORBR|nr:glycosyl hydrolase family 47-domain-containing protein [Sordaria brevicollis]